MPSTTSQITLSIQIRLGGFSFSIRQHAAEVSSGVIDGFDFSMLDPRRWGVDAYDRAVVWCDVPWATLVPVEVYRPEATERYLGALNLLATDRQAMVSQEGAAVVVWAIERAVVDAFLAAVPTQELDWKHPLAWLLSEPRSNSIGVLVGGEATHVVVFDHHGLVGARSLTTAGPDDLLYALVQMSRRCDPERQFDVWVVGKVDAVVETTLRSCYARVWATNDSLALVRAL